MNLVILQYCFHNVNVVPLLSGECRGVARYLLFLFNKIAIIRHA
jgi:hypothetical protein